MPKLYKELAKFTLFSSLSFIFKNFFFYHRWKASHVFSGPMEPFWKNILSTHFFSPHSPIVLKLDAGSTAPVSIDRVAVVIHSFYPEILKEILSDIQTSGLPQPKLFVTSPESVKTENLALLQRADIPFELILVENRGRDILPFLNSLPSVLSQNFPLILKLHTKKSGYLGAKNGWKDALLQELLHPEKVNTIVSAFERHARLGMLGPYGQSLPMSLFYGANAISVEKLSLELGLDASKLQGLYFVAGSMYYARPEALQPILELGLTKEDFEEEAGQLDGTLAHALERVISSAVIKNGFVIGDTSSTPDEITCALKLSHAFSL